MIAAKDELAHLVDCLSEAEAENVLAALDQHCPEIFCPKVPTYLIQRADGKTVWVSVPE